MKVRLSFLVKQLHQLELDSRNYPDAPQDDAGEFADWVDNAGWRVHEGLLDRIDSVYSWVETEDEVDVEGFEEVSA